MYFCNLWDLRIHLHLSNAAWHFKLDCLPCCPVLSGLTDAATAHAACLYVFDMAQSNHGRWRKKKDVKWRGGYIPPVLHSFLNNVLKVNQKEKQIIKISTFKFHKIHTPRSALNHTICCDHLLRWCWLQQKWHSNLQLYLYLHDFSAILSK